MSVRRSGDYSMNVVIFGKGFGKPLQINLSGRGAAAVGAVFAGILGTLAFGAGYYYSAQNGSGMSQTEVATLAEELDFTEIRNRRNPAAD